jgi:hypothetical protein
MKVHHLRRIAACLLLGIALPACAQSARQEWAAFLETPTAETYRPLSSMLEACRAGPCERELKPDSASVRRLVGLMREGLLWPIRLAFSARRFVDGGDLEDVSRGLGAVADRQPVVFLQEVQLHQLSSAQLRSIVQMMPEDVVDDFAKRRSAMAERIRSLSTVSDAGLAQARNQAIAILQVHLERVPLDSKGPDPKK